jgi:hypothetical protein
MAYSQSYGLTAYLLAGYGQKKMQTLLLTLAEGRGYDEALQQVYGFNVDGLEQRWREAIGAPPRSIPPTPTPLTADLVPTYVPISAPESVPTPVGNNAPDAEAERPSTGCSLGMMPLLLLAGLGWRQRPAINRRTKKQRPINRADGMAN